MWSARRAEIDPPQPVSAVGTQGISAEVTAPSRTHPLTVKVKCSNDGSGINGNVCGGSGNHQRQLAFESSRQCMHIPFEVVKLEHTAMA
jgi:hypothetical protein